MLWVGERLVLLDRMKQSVKDIEKKKKKGRDSTPTPFANYKMAKARASIRSNDRG